MFLSQVVVMVSSFTIATGRFCISLPTEPRKTEGCIIGNSKRKQMPLKKHVQNICFIILYDLTILLGKNITTGLPVTESVQDIDRRLQNPNKSKKIS